MRPGAKVLVIAAVAVMVVAGGLSATYTFWLSPYTMVQDRQIGANVSVSGNVPRSINAVEAKIPSAPFLTAQLLGPVIQLMPSGKLPAPITLRFKLSRQLQEN